MISLVAEERCFEFGIEMAKANDKTNKRRKLGSKIYANGQ